MTNLLDDLRNAQSLDAGILELIKRCLRAFKAIEGIHKAAYKPISDGS